MMSAFLNNPGCGPAQHLATVCFFYQKSPLNVPVVIKRRHSLTTSGHQNIIQSSFNCHFTTWGYTTKCKL